MVSKKPQKMVSKKPQNEGAAEGLFAVPEPWMLSTQDIQRVMMGGVNPDGSLKPCTIIALLNYRGISHRDIGQSLGISGQQVWQVVVRRRHTRYVQDAIAACLQMEADRVWGRR